MSAAKHEISDLAYTAAARVAAAGCIESPCRLAIITWKLLRHIHGDNCMTGHNCLRNGMSTPSGTLPVLGCELLVVGLMASTSANIVQC